MQLKMNQILSFQNFANTLKEAKLPLKTAYKLNKILLRVETEFQFYQKTFAQILETYGKRDENGNYVYSSDGASIEIVDGKRDECAQKVYELENLEVEFENIGFTIDELDFLNLTIQEMNCLMPFIIE